VSVDERREAKLRQLARVAMAPPLSEKHTDDPLLGLIRDGDHGDDIADAIAHVARCAHCRAKLTEGDLERKAVVVMAIEAPSKSLPDVARAAEESNARLLDRGEGRWTAVVDADKSEAFARKLEQGDQSVVHRLAAATPVEIPVDSSHRPRGPDPAKAGFDAAEVQAWAQVARAPRRKVQTASAGWALVAIVAVGAAMGVAYLLASR
jgi:hypothetical protein